MNLHNDEPRNSSAPVVEHTGTERGERRHSHSSATILHTVLTVKKRTQTEYENMSSDDVHEKSNCAVSERPVKAIPSQRPFRRITIHADICSGRSAARGEAPQASGPHSSASCEKPSEGPSQPAWINVFACMHKKRRFVGPDRDAIIRDFENYCIAERLSPGQILEMLISKKLLVPDSVMNEDRMDEDEARDECRGEQMRTEEYTHKDDVEELEVEANLALAFSDDKEEVSTLPPSLNM